ncbi:MAG: 30S ribosomal protein S20 [Candidatus Pacebacteria bacterium]|nr:30S ribosomal protein S20 [Candidatus Paceibacterota bacterium]
MAITSSAKKALRASKRKHVFNVRRQTAIETPLRQFKKSIAAKNANEAKNLIPALYKALDKAAKTGAIKANTASRRKSRLMKALKKLG